MQVEKSKCETLFSSLYLNNLGLCSQNSVMLFHIEKNDSVKRERDTPEKKKIDVCNFFMNKTQNE